MIQLKKISYSHAQFLIKLVELTNEYDKLAYSSLLLRYIKSYFKTIVIVCNDNKEVFKLWTIPDVPRRGKLLNIRHN